MNSIGRTKSSSEYKFLSHVSLLLFALFLSGVAAIINQIVWQRSLKIYLAGSESISSMIVVLTFMLGLGAGSFYMGIQAHKIRNPMRALGLIEVFLFATNLFVTFLLGLNISESIYTFQRIALSIGMPLQLLYALIAIGLLLVPCLLMGITMPLVAEISQRQFKFKDRRFVNLLFVLNTLGAVLGALVSGFYLMPYFGQQASLLFAASFNCAAGIIVLGIYQSKYRHILSVIKQLKPVISLSKLSPEEVMGFWLGFLALGYESKMALPACFK